MIENFKHGFFKRTGGVSINEFSSLNCKYSSFDTISKINSNRAIVSNLMGIKNSDLITLKQMHSSDVINITDAVIKHTIIVSINGPIMDTIPSSIGSFVLLLA